MSSPSDRELEERLSDAGNKLLDPPSSIDELLSLLDKVESCLSKVEQSPTKSMQTALSPSLKALATCKLLKHQSADVKVAVASCISEITRITAPDAPYEDDQMKEIFQLIVSSFANLSDKSNRSYTKRVSILETVSKVRSCVVMLDLECDALILEMFGHFFKEIRDYHPDNVFSSMETIMALVLEESEDIYQELLSPILTSLKKGNKEILPIARKLGERVLESSATKVKPYLIQAVKSLGIPLKDYSQVVVSICDQEISSAVVKGDDHAATRQMADESKLEMTSLDNVAEVDKKIAKEEASHESVDPDVDNSPKSVGGNGITQTGEDDSVLYSNSKKQEETSKKEGGDYHADRLKCSNVLSKADIGKITEKSECKIEQTSKRRGRKSSTSKSGPSDGSLSTSEKEAEELLDSHKSDTKDDASSPCEEPSIDAAIPSDIEDIKSSSEAAVASDIVKETKPSTEAAVSSHAVKGMEAPESECGNVAPAAPTGLLEEGRARKVGRPKKKVTSTKDTRSVADAISNKASEAMSDQEVKPAKRPGKKPATRVSNKDTSSTIVTSKKESGTASDSEVKASKVVETSSDNGDGSSLKHPVDDKKQGHVIGVIEKDVSESTDTDDKELFSSPKSKSKSTKDSQLEDTPQTSSKRKRTPVVDKASGGKDGEDLVGSKIKVWWPKDKKFYEGVVDSYDSAKKKHKVLYIDGDEEILNLSRQKWVTVDCDSESDKGEGAGESSLDASSDAPQKKKVKASLDLSAKPGNSSSKRGGGTSSNKGKGTATKPSRKSKVGDSAGKSKGHTPKNVSKSKAPIKSRDNDGASKSKDVEMTPKTSSNSNKSRGKNSKVQSRSAKVKEVEDASSDSGARESVQSKSSKGKGSETKIGKKRQRGARS